jgi:hypothetical protein
MHKRAARPGGTPSPRWRGRLGGGELQRCAFISVGHALELRRVVKAAAAGPCKFSDVRSTPPAKLRHREAAPELAEKVVHPFDLAADEILAQRSARPQGRGARIRHACQQSAAARA